MRGQLLGPGGVGGRDRLAKVFLEAMRPWSVDKASPNFLEPDEGVRRLRASFGEEKFKRLAGLKARYDPENLSSLNVNILTRLDP